MILNIFLMVLILILALVLFMYQKQVKKELAQWEEKYWDENRLHLDTKLNLEGKWHTALDEVSKLEAQRFEQWERAEVLEQKVIDLKQELSERPIAKADPELQEEQGTFVRVRKTKRATPETYRNVFDLDVNGQRVLEHLTMVFCKDAFTPDDKGGERQTSYNLGAQGVINFIVNNINTANNPEYKESDE